MVNQLISSWFGYLSFDTVVAYATYIIKTIYKGSFSKFCGAVADTYFGTATICFLVVPIVLIMVMAILMPFYWWYVRRTDITIRVRLEYDKIDKKRNYLLKNYYLTRNKDRSDEMQALIEKNDPEVLYLLEKQVYLTTIRAETNTRKFPTYIILFYICVILGMIGLGYFGVGVAKLLGYGHTIMDETRKFRNASYYLLLEYVDTIDAAISSAIGVKTRVAKAFFGTSKYDFNYQYDIFEQILLDCKLYRDPIDTIFKLFEGGNSILKAFGSIIFYPGINFEYERKGMEYITNVTYNMENLVHYDQYINQNVDVIMSYNELYPKQLQKDINDLNIVYFKTMVKQKLSYPLKYLIHVFIYESSKWYFANEAFEIARYIIPDEKIGKIKYYIIPCDKNGENCVENYSLYDFILSFTGIDLSQILDVDFTWENVIYWFYGLIYSIRPIAFQQKEKFDKLYYSMYHFYYVSFHQLVFEMFQSDCDYSWCGIGGSLSYAQVNFLILGCTVGLFLLFMVIPVAILMSYCIYVKYHKSSCVTVNAWSCSTCYLITICLTYLFLFISLIPIVLISPTADQLYQNATKVADGYFSLNNLYNSNVKVINLRDSDYLHFSRKQVEVNTTNVYSILSSFKFNVTFDIEYFFKNNIPHSEVDLTLLLTNYFELFPKTLNVDFDGTIIDYIFNHTANQVLGNVVKFNNVSATEYIKSALEKFQDAANETDIGKTQTGIKKVVRFSLNNYVDQLWYHYIGPKINFEALNDVAVPLSYCDTIRFHNKFIDQGDQVTSFSTLEKALSTDELNLSISEPILEEKVRYYATNVISTYFEFLSAHNQLDQYLESCAKYFGKSDVDVNQCVLLLSRFPSESLIYIANNENVTHHGENVNIFERDMLDDVCITKKQNEKMVNHYNDVLNGAKYNPELLVEISYRIVYALYNRSVASYAGFVNEKPQSNDPDLLDLLRLYVLNAAKATAYCTVIYSHIRAGYDLDEPFGARARRQAAFSQLIIGSLPQLINGTQYIVGDFVGNVIPPCHKQPPRYAYITPVGEQIPATLRLIADSIVENVAQAFDTDERFNPLQRCAAEHRVLSNITRSVSLLLNGTAWLTLSDDSPLDSRLLSLFPTHTKQMVIDLVGPFDYFSMGLFLYFVYCTLGTGFLVLGYGYIAYYQEKDQKGAGMVRVPATELVVEKYEDMTTEELAPPFFEVDEHDMLE